MNITPGHFELSPEQRRFKILLSNFPWLIPFWDFEKRECDVDRLRDALPAMSHGEQIMAQFFSAVWLGKNILDFDVIEAGKSLDPEHLQVISDWLTNPEFP